MEKVEIQNKIIKLRKKMRREILAKRDISHLLAEENKLMEERDWKLLK